MKTIIYTFLGAMLTVPAFANACMTEFSRGGYGMMGHSGGMSVFMVAGAMVWTVVGILVAVWLWQHINKK